MSEMNPHELKFIGFEKWKKCQNHDCKNNPTDNYESCMECHLCDPTKKKKIVEKNRKYFN